MTQNTCSITCPTTLNTLIHVEVISGLLKIFYNNLSKQSCENMSISTRNISFSSSPDFTAGCKTLITLLVIIYMYLTKPSHCTQTRHYSIDHLAGIQLLALGMHCIVFTISVPSLQHLSVSSP